jgi:hypothetical protein
MVTKFKSRSGDVSNTEGVNGPYEVTANLIGVLPATAGNYGMFHIATRREKVVGARVIWDIAGGAGATVMLERLQGVEAKDAGDDLWTAAIATSGTARTPATPTLITTEASKILEIGDRLGLVNAGTLTALDSLVVTVLLEAVGPAPDGETA